MRLVLHVGLPKTGSTHLQAQIFHHRARLSALGVGLAGTATNGFRRPPYNLARELAGDPRFDPGAGSWADLGRELGGLDMPVALVSCEGLAACLDRTALDRMVEVARQAGRRLVLLAVVREPIGWLNSAYQQNVRDFAVVEPFDAFRDQCLAEGFGDYEALFGPALEHPEVELSALSFDAFRAEEPLVALARALGLDPAPVAGLDRVEGRENVSVGPPTVALARFVGVALRSIAPGFSSADPRYRPVRRTFRELSAAAGWNEEPFWGWTEESIEAALAELGPPLDRFSRRVWGTPWPDATPRGRRANETTLSRFGPRDAARALAIVAAVHERLDEARPTSSERAPERAAGTLSAVRSWLRSARGGAGG